MRNVLNNILPHDGKGYGVVWVLDVLELCSLLADVGALLITFNNIFLRPGEANLKIWWKLLFIQLIPVFWEILDLVYTDIIPNRMRNIHAILTQIFPVFNFCGGARAKPKAGLCFMYRSNLCWCLVVCPWYRSLTWILGLKVVRVQEVSWGCITSSTEPGKKRSHGGQYSWCVTFYNYITIVFICCAGWHTSKNFFLDWWRSITCNMVGLYVGKAHHGTVYHQLAQGT